eukprot:UN23228
MNELRDSDKFLFSLSFVIVVFLITCEKFSKKMIKTKGSLFATIGKLIFVIFMFASPLIHP